MFGSGEPAPKSVTVVSTKMAGGAGVLKLAGGAELAGEVALLAKASAEVTRKWYVVEGDKPVRVMPCVVTSDALDAVSVSALESVP